MACESYLYFQCLCSTAHHRAFTR